MPRIKLSSLAPLVALIIPVCACADTSGETDWSLAPVGGTYSWNGNSNSGLVGSNIGVASVLGVGTANNNGGLLAISFGELNFTSGAYNGNGSNWKWGAGGVLNVTGCIAGVTSAVCTGSNDVTLLSDDFTSVSIVPVLQLGILSFDVVFGNLTGDLNPTVASYFGLSTAFNATSLNLMLTTSTPGKALTGVNLGGQIKANSTTVAVPEEWGIGTTLGFLAIVMAVFGLAHRFRLVRPVGF